MICAEVDGQDRMQLVILDFGLAEELDPTVRFHFLSFMQMVGRGDGARAVSVNHNKHRPNSSLYVILIGLMGFARS